MADLIDVPLFDLAAEPVTVPKEKPAAALRRRQAEAIAAGYHPLTVATRIPIRLHPDVPRYDATRSAGTTTLGVPIDSEHPRCGGCVHRVLDTWRHKFSKCDLPGRISHGEGTDVRAWWPACERWEASDG